MTKPVTVATISEIKYAVIGEHAQETIKAGYQIALNPFYSSNKTLNVCLNSAIALQFFWKTVKNRD